jgi:hypothetical protein
MLPTLLAIVSNNSMDDCGVRHLAQPTVEHCRLMHPRRPNKRVITAKTLDEFKASVEREQRGKDNKLRSAGPKVWDRTTTWDE